MTPSNSEIIHIFENSRLVSDHFTPETVTAAYVAALAALHTEADRPQARDAKKPPFSASRAEEYFFMLRDSFHDEKERIFKRDNEGRHPFDQLYSAEYQKALGKELALREVLDYFSKYDFPEDGNAGEEGAE